MAMAQHYQSRIVRRLYNTLQQERNWLNNNNDIGCILVNFIFIHAKDNAFAITVMTRRRASLDW